MALFTCEQPAEHPLRALVAALAPVALWPLLLVALVEDRRREAKEPLPRASIASRPRLWRHGRASVESEKHR